MTETTNQPHQQPAQQQAQYPGQFPEQDTQTLPRPDFHDPYGPPVPPAGEPPRTGGPGRPQRGVAMVAAVALAAGLIGGGAGAFIENRLDGGTVTSSLTGTPVSGQAANAAAGTVSRVASAVLPSVVKITVNGEGQSAEGSGVIISSDGLIL